MIPYTLHLYFILFVSPGPVGTMALWEVDGRALGFGLAFT